jgi:hypothetical protein
VLHLTSQVIALLVLCLASLVYEAEAVPRLDCENNPDDGLLCYDQLEGIFFNRKLR